MTYHNILETDIRRENNPQVGALANKLIMAAHRAGGDLDEDAWSLVSEVLNYAAMAEQEIAAQRARISELETLSETDELTALPNRRGLHSFLANALAASKRYGEDGALAFIDLDGFKEINDRHGHQAGDAVLKVVAKALRRKVRQCDLVARQSGDEFVVVLTRCSRAEGMSKVFQIKSAINCLSIRHDGAVIPIRASIGVATFGPGTSQAALLHEADMAMYREKSRGPLTEQ